MQVINVVAAIIKKEDKVFITQRGHGEFKGVWEFPGGKIESGETPEEAIVREIKEELKSEVRAERFFDEINDIHGDKCFNVKFFICSLVSGELELTEHLDAKWVKPTDINENDFMPADKTVIENLKNDKHKAFGVLHKYANSDLIGKEREALGEALAKESKRIISNFKGVQP